MKLELKIIYKDQGDDYHSYVLSEDGQCDPIDPIPYYMGYGQHDKDVAKDRPLTLVEAKLSGSFTKDSEYWLQVGFDPDVIAEARPKNGVAIFRYRKKSKFRLFQSTMGSSRLRLLEVVYNEDDEPDIRREVLSVHVFVEPPREKVKQFTSMIKDMHEAPPFFQDYYRRQMLLCGFRTNWDEGYSSYADPDDELRAVKQVLDELREPMDYITKAPKTSFGFVDRKLLVERIRHCRGRVARKLERLSESNSGADRIVTSFKVANYEVTAHAVIKEFFSRLILRCDDIKSCFVSKIEKLKNKMAECGSLYENRDSRHNNPAYIRQMSNMKELLKNFESKIKDVDSVKVRVEKFRGIDIFKNVSKAMTIFDVERTAFSGHIGYELAYDIILNFERCRHSWKGSASKKYKVRKLTFDADRKENGENKFARKYSMVYEFWCYYRLIKASESICEFVHGQELMADEGCRCVFRKGDVELVIVHGFSARANAKNDTWAEFWLEQDFDDSNKGNIGTRELTPDFAFIFKNLKSGKSEWIVADVKSDGSMKKRIIKRREKYLEKVRRKDSLTRDEDSGASQSWILYSGEDEYSSGGVECPPPRFEENGFEDLYGGTSAYSFSPEGGIEYKRKSDLPRGHVHANIESLGDDNKPFEDFIKGEFATMERELM
ncbi:MAG: hypothetical protein IJH50_14510 [Kiritimatiellae bacterium]|nr:hypothetical protein [Kiritimatiellia bacterium]